MIEDVLFNIDDEVMVASNQDLREFHFYHNKIYKVYDIIYNENDDTQSIKIKNDFVELHNFFSFRFTVPIRKIRKEKLKNLENA